MHDAQCTIFLMHDAQLGYALKANCASCIVNCELFLGVFDGGLGIGGGVNAVFVDGDFHVVGDFDHEYVFFHFAHFAVDAALGDYL